MATNFDFKELSNDADIIFKLQEFSQSVSKIEEVLQPFTDLGMYDQLTNAKKIKYNHLMAYSLNSLYWMYLKAEGFFLKQYLLNFTKYFIIENCYKLIFF